MPPKLRLVLDYGPLLLFFVANMMFGIFTATAAIMAAIVLAIAVEFTIQRTVSPILLFTGAMVLIFGGLTLWLSSEIFIKIKVTLLYVLFALTLIAGLFTNRIFLKMLLGHTLRLPDPAWRSLTWRWAAFFLCLAAANEIIWRNFSTNIWVSFKVFGVTSLTFLFMLAQAPFIANHMIEGDETPPAA
jgi:intracellular septation protein